jgi:hypothetical protein
MKHTLDFALTENESMMTEFQQKKKRERNVSKLNRKKNVKI